MVDRAKGQLMDHHGLSEADAFAFIQKTAMDRRHTMKRVAEDVIDGELAPRSELSLADRLRGATS